MGIVFHYIMIVTLIALGFLAFIIYLQIFQEHMSFFLFLWFFLPVVALWLNTRSVRSSGFSIFELKVLRNLLVAAAVLLSFTFFANSNHIRDSVGQRLVDGYEVEYYKGEVSVSTSHWYSRFGLWLFECAFLCACAALPYITWRGTNHAVNKAIQEGSARARNQEVENIWKDEPSYVTQEEAIRAHATREKKPDEQSE
ncbi:MAG: hypothetical protein ABSF90_26600 [Syntrophobacteraceae bacterium]